MCRRPVVDIAVILGSFKVKQLFTDSAAGYFLTNNNFGGRHCGWSPTFARPQCMMGNAWLDQFNEKYLCHTEA